MTTTTISWSRKGTKFAEFEATNMTSPDTEALLTDDGDALVFNVAPYDDAVFMCVNKHASTNMTLKPFVSCFTDPGSANTDFGEDSLWVQAKDIAGENLDITVTADGTPANNILYRVNCKGVKYIAFRGTNGSGDLSNTIDFALMAVKD